MFYHQEFDLDTFKPGPCANPKSIMSLQHLARGTRTLEQVMKYLPDWELKLHGAGMRDGPLPSLQIPQTIRDVGFVWHVKGNEGYGYNIHHTFATGRPMLVDYNGNQGMTAADLYEKGVTVIDAKRQHPKKIAQELERAVGEHDKWCEAVYNRFKQVVDFDQEELEIRKFMERLQ